LTAFLLNFTLNMPHSVDLVWHVERIPALFILCYLCLLLWLGIAVRYFLESRRLEQQDLMI
jgi:hypothetical protein